MTVEPNPSLFGPPGASRAMKQGLHAKKNIRNMETYAAPSPTLRVSGQDERHSPAHGTEERRRVKAPLLLADGTDAQVFQQASDAMLGMLNGQTSGAYERDYFALMESRPVCDGMCLDLSKVLEFEAANLEEDEEAGPEEDAVHDVWLADLAALKQVEDRTRYWRQELLGVWATHHAPGSLGVSCTSSRHFIAEPLPAAAGTRGNACARPLISGVFGRTTAAPLPPHAERKWSKHASTRAYQRAHARNSLLARKACDAIRPTFSSQISTVRAVTTHGGMITLGVAETAIGGAAKPIRVPRCIYHDKVRTCRPASRHAP
jgi:hypothetical protein